MQEVSGFGVVHKGINTKVAIQSIKNTPKAVKHGTENKFLKLVGKERPRYRPPKRIGDKIIEAEFR